MVISKLDFNELKQVDSPGYGLQGLVAEIGFQLDVHVIPGGRGADQGKDLLFEVKSQVLPGMVSVTKVLVNCKDWLKRKKQLTVDDLGNWPARVREHGCQGFLLVASMPVTDDLVSHIQRVAEQERMCAAVWQPQDIQRILLQEQDGKFKYTIARFFPKSFEQGAGPNSMPADYFLECITLLEKEIALDVALESISGLRDDFLGWEVFKRLSARPDVQFDKDLFSHVADLLRTKNDMLEMLILNWLIGTFANEGRTWLSENCKKDGDAIKPEDFSMTGLFFTEKTDQSLVFQLSGHIGFLPEAIEEQVFVAIINWSLEGMKVQDFFSYTTNPASAGESA